MAKFKIRRIDPQPSLHKRRAPAELTAAWTEAEIERRTCTVCKTTYLTAGDSGDCDRYHIRWP